METKLEQIVAELEAISALLGSNFFWENDYRESFRLSSVEIVFRKADDGWRWEATWGQDRSLSHGGVSPTLAESKRSANQFLKDRVQSLLAAHPEIPAAF